jgi:16S rRNA (cytosine1402-N4)-methyltransferase
MCSASERVNSQMITRLHEPVLLAETIAGLGVRPNGVYVDGTLGDGGHASAILEASAPGGRLLGLDADPEAIERCREHLRHFGERLTTVHANFVRLGEIATAYGFGSVDGIALDLGLSSRQLSDAKRGFSFQSAGPLDMRFNPQEGRTAADLVNSLAESELADLLWKYGEERQSRRIAREIVRSRPLQSTSELADAVARAIGHRGRIHPATRTFMALRIATNAELAALQEVLPQALSLLAPGRGRLAVLSYHSLEDRVTKQWMQREAKDCICPPESPECRCGHARSLRLLYRKPITPSAQEIERNPRSRSARLRAAERLAATQPRAQVEGAR